MDGPFYENWFHYYKVKSFLTLSVPTTQNGQTHSNNSLATADELFECVWPFCGVDV